MKSADAPPVAARDRAMAIVGLEPGRSIAHRRCVAVETSKTAGPRMLCMQWSVSLRSSQSMDSNGKADGFKGSEGMGGGGVWIGGGVGPGVAAAVWVSAPGTG